MTPLELRLGIAAGSIAVRRGRPPLPKTWRGKPLSPFQGRRLSGILPVLREYLKMRKTMRKMAAERGVKYQRVQQMIAVGIEWFEAVGWIEIKEKQ